MLLQHYKVYVSHHSEAFLQTEMLTLRQLLMDIGKDNPLLVSYWCQWVRDNLLRQHMTQVHTALTVHRVDSALVRLLRRCWDVVVTDSLAPGQTLLSLIPLLQAKCTLR